jgi:putative DNA primase/helicase
MGTPNEMAFTALRFMNRRGKWKSHIVPSSVLTANAAVCIARLTELGYIWPPHRALRQSIIDALSVAKPSLAFQVTDVPGWHGKRFVLPGENYTRRGPDRKQIKMSHNPAVQLGAFKRIGTLDGWKRFVAASCRYSTSSRLAVAAVFAAPNLRSLGCPSFGLNFSGPSSGGKTLVVRMAASTGGLNSDGGPETWDGTAVAFEQRAMGHRDSIMPIDDLSHLSGDAKHVRELAKLFTFRIAGNRQKARAGQYVKAHDLPNVDWRVIALSTSEDPLWGHLTSHSPGQRQIRGEEVRLVNIRACVSEVGDIFDAPNASKHVGETLEKRVRFVQDQERRCLKYQGVAYREYLLQRAMDVAADEKLKKYIDEFVSATPLPDRFRTLGRIRRYFAIIYASAALAIDYGILQWSKKATRAAIASCMADAMEQLIPNSTDTAPQMTVISEFKTRIEGANFLQIDGNRANRPDRAKLAKASGITKRGSSGKVQHLLFASRFDEWYPSIAERRKVANVLRSLGIFRAGRRSDTTTRQVFIAEAGGKLSCYSVSKKKLAAAASTSSLSCLRPCGR